MKMKIKKTRMDFSRKNPTHLREHGLKKKRDTMRKDRPQKDPPAARSDRSLRRDQGSVSWNKFGRFDNLEIQRRKSY